VVQPGVDSEARWVKKGGESVFGYRQLTVVDGDGLVMAVTTTAANCHDSEALPGLLDKAAKQSFDAAAVTSQKPDHEIP